MITMICGPMYSGKSTMLVQKMERFYYAKKRILYVTPTLDTRGYTTHNLAYDVAERFGDRIKYMVVTDFSTDIEDFSEFDDFDGIFVDEYFMIKNCIKLCDYVLKQPTTRHVDVYFAGLLADSDAKTWDEAVEILPFCDDIIKLQGVCSCEEGDLAPIIGCGSQHGNYSGYLGGKKTSRIEVGDVKYACLCRKCYRKLVNYHSKPSQ